MIVNDQPVIVVGIDGSDLSIDALKWAADHARRIHGRILAVTGYEVPWTIFLAPTATEADYARAAREVLARTVVEALGSDPDIEVDKELSQDNPARALTRLSRGAELLVVGSHGRGELPGMHLGSVAGYCVHHAPCPVLLFRGPDTAR